MWTFTKCFGCNKWRKVGMFLSTISTVLFGFSSRKSIICDQKHATSTILMNAKLQANRTTTTESALLNYWATIFLTIISLLKVMNCLLVDSLWFSDCRWHLVTTIDKCRIFFSIRRQTINIHRDDTLKHFPFTYPYNTQSRTSSSS